VSGPLDLKIEELAAEADEISEHWPYTDAANELMRDYWAQIGAQTITALDMSRCPKQALYPGHYREDGTCRCDEREEATEALRQAADLRRRVLEMHRRAKEWHRCT
jgi:hypothetical protein